MRENNGLKWLLGMAAVIVIIAGLKAAEAIVIPVLLALFISIISLPFLRSLTKRGLSPLFATVTVLSVILIFGGILASLVTQSIDLFLERMPQYQDRLQSIFLSWTPWLEKWDIPIDRTFISEHLNPSQMMGIVGGALSGIGSVLTNLFLVVFIVIFLLMEEATFSIKMQAALPDAQKSIKDAQGFIRQVNRYLMIKTTISFFTGVFVTIWLWWIGVDFPILWGLIAMMMNYIPNVGSLLAAIPAVLLALVQLGLGDAVMVAIGYVVINVLMGNLIEPRYMGRGLGLSPLVVFLSLVLWGWLFGPVGMFLSIPLTMIVKIALEQTDSTRWIAILLGNSAHFSEHNTAGPQSDG